MYSVVIFSLLLCVAGAFHNQGQNILRRKNLTAVMDEKLVSQRIINGKRARPNQIKYMAGLLLVDPINSLAWCGGALITNIWVLTAAHCLYEQHNVIVFLGSINRLISPVHYNVSMNDMVLHHDFNHAALSNDIALIRIPPVSFSQAIQPIALPAAGFNLYIGSDVTISGWGFETPTAQTLSSVLKYANVKVVRNIDCRPFYFVPSITNEKVCTNNYRNRAVCHGDSGGPLVLPSEQVLVGISSFGSTHGCLAGPPDVFTRVTFHLPWIHSITGIRH